MGEIAVAIVKWTFRITFIIGVLIGIISLISVITTYMIVGFNTTVLSDIFGIIQIWLPFNLNIVLVWLSITATAYITYRLAIMSFTLLNTFVGKN